MIDENGYRENVGIIICNNDGKLFWAKNCGKKRGWQFPQGGIMKNETLMEAMYRELYEETGLTHKNVEIVTHTKDWFYYQLPKNFIRQEEKQLCIGQKQKWFLLKLTEHESCIKLECEDYKPEFDNYCWVDYWHPVEEVIFFKKDVYRAVLGELERSYRLISEF